MRNNQRGKKKAIVANVSSDGGGSVRVSEHNIEAMLTCLKTLNITNMAGGLVIDGIASGIACHIASQHSKGRLTEDEQRLFCIIAAWSMNEDKEVLAVLDKYEITKGRCAILRGIYEFLEKIKFENGMSHTIIGLSLYAAWESNLQEVAQRLVDLSALKSFTKEERDEFGSLYAEILSKVQLEQFIKVANATKLDKK